MPRYRLALVSFVCLMHEFTGAKEKILAELLISCTPVDMTVKRHHCLGLGRNHRVLYQRSPRTYMTHPSFHSEDQLMAERVVYIPAGLSHSLTIMQRAMESADHKDCGMQLWAAGLLLADILTQRDLSNRRVLELGSGVGIGALAAASAGAVVTATDGFNPVLEVIRANGRLNNLDLTVRPLRWGYAEDIAALRGRYDLIVGSNILYKDLDLLILTLLSLSEPGHTEVILLGEARSQLEKLLHRTFLNDIQANGLFSVSSCEERTHPEGGSTAILVVKLRRTGTEIDSSLLQRRLL